jgi:hypothetical protein
MSLLRDATPFCRVIERRASLGFDTKSIDRHNRLDLRQSED